MRARTAAVFVVVASWSPIAPGDSEPKVDALPIVGITGSEIHDTFESGRSGGRRHEATDILAPRGTPIHAVTAGTIQKLFWSDQGGNTIYEFDKDARYCYYYAHLDHYAQGLKEGDEVQPGDIIGYVGATGNADPAAPHLHLAILRLGPEKRWWGGDPLNPYPILMQLFESGRHPD